MKSPSSTIHVSEKGTVTVLAASLDAGECLAVYRNCTKPGAVFYSRMGHLDKDKKVESEAQIKAKADARAANVQRIREAELIEAEAAAAEAAENAKQAKAKFDALKPKTRKRAGVAE